MKKLNLKNLKLDSSDILQRSELKAILGGRNIQTIGDEGGGSCKDDDCSETVACGSQCICDLRDNKCFLH